MNGGNESSGADRAGGPVATSVPIGWQRCVREGAVFYIRYGFSGTPRVALVRLSFRCLSFPAMTPPL